MPGLPGGEAARVSTGGARQSGAPPVCARGSDGTSQPDPRRGPLDAAPDAARDTALHPTLDPALGAALDAAWHVRGRGFPARIAFVRPKLTLPVSLTGPSCPLGCAHCGGHYLRRMATLEEALAGSTPRAARATSFLVSGGCLAGSGVVPFMDRLPELRRLKRRGRLNFHVGLAGEEEARALADLADRVSLDLVGDDDTIAQVLGLDRTVADYRRTLGILSRRSRVTPHVLAGLYGGEMRGERRAVELAAEAGCDALVFIVLIPTPGTGLAGCRPPAASEVAALLAWSRQVMPSAWIGLGCMRPPGHYREELDPLAVRAGVQAIVQPAPGAVRLAARLGLEAVRAEECCVL